MAGLTELSAAPVFHLAIPVTSLDEAAAFYAGTLGCPMGRRSARWIDFDFFGSQLTVHLVDHAQEVIPTNEVDDHAVPVRHFGLVLKWDDWHRAVDHLSGVGVTFRVPPHIRFEGEIGEQATFFVTDPCGNCLEFKAFRDPSRLFAS